MKLLSTCFLIMLFLQSRSQDCRTAAVYKTSSANETLDSVQLKLPLFFRITGDSIIAAVKENGQDELMGFKILSKQCFPGDGLPVNKIIFKTSVFHRLETLYPLLTVNLADASKKYIEILYENKRSRFFPIEKIIE
jgi:hypothetical protein